MEIPRPGGFELQMFIDRFLAEHRYAPSIRELREFLGCDSISTAQLWLKEYRAQGFLDWLPGQPRTYHTPTFRAGK